MNSSLTPILATPILATTEGSRLARQPEFCDELESDPNSSPNFSPQLSLAGILGQQSHQVPSERIRYLDLAIEQLAKSEAIISKPLGHMACQAPWEKIKPTAKKPVIC